MSLSPIEPPWRTAANPREATIVAPRRQFNEAGADGCSEAQDDTDEVAPRNAGEREDRSVRVANGMLAAERHD